MNDDGMARGWSKLPHGLVDQLAAIPNSALRVLLVLMRHADAQGQAWPSVGTLQRMTGVRKRSLFRALAWLEKQGFVRREQRRTPTGAKLNTCYHLCPPVWDSVKREPTLGSQMTLGRFPNDTRVVSNGNHKQELSEQEPVNKKARSPQSFKKPSVQEIAAYCKARGNTVDPQAFWDFYESKGWRVGNTPMKDWQAAVRTWERRPQYGNGQPSPKAKPKKTNHVYLN